MTAIGPGSQGKTPLACAASMAMSNNLIKMHGLAAEPCFKVGSHLDFFRGDPARLHVPAILDDADLRAESMASLKAFMDVSAEDAKVMVRYTTSSFAKHQPRLLCTNTFENAEEPDVFMDPSSTSDVTIDHDTFMRMIRVAFNNQAYDEDIAALLKRCTMVIFGARHVYLRLPSPDKVHAKVISYPLSGRDLLTQECKERFGMYKSGQSIQAPATDLAWSTTFVQKCIRNDKFNGFFTTMASECPFTGNINPERHTKPNFDAESPLRMLNPGQAGSSGDCAPTAQPPAPPSMMPRSRAFKRSLSQSSHHEIDLGSPPKAKATSMAGSSAGSSSASMAPPPIPIQAGTDAMADSILEIELAELMDAAPSFPESQEGDASD